VAGAEELERVLVQLEKSPGMPCRCWRSFSKGKRIRNVFLKAFFFCS
jgi:hypothetical protein